jgi:hypothetical protein
MPAVAHKYYLGKDCSFSFASGKIENKDVKTVTISRETAAEADVTTRGSGNEQEFAFVRANTTIEVVVLDHSATVGDTGAITMTLPTGSSGPVQPTGTFQVMSISEPQELDGAIEFTISLRKTPTVTG